MKLLFICKHNKMRSRTGESIYSSEGEHLARSAGTAKNAKVKLSGELILWADIVFVMEREMEELLRENFPAEVLNKKIIILNIPDNYYFMEPELIDLIKVRVSPYL